MVFKSPWLSTTAVVVLLLYYFVTSSSQLQPGDDGIVFGEGEMLQYYISSSLLDPCPAEMSPCLTLNQFASNRDYYLSKNTSVTLTLQQGTHRLDSELTVENVSQLSIVGDRMQNVSIECNERFTFVNVTKLNVSGLKFVGCTGNRIQSVEQFFLDNCTFNGLQRSGTALNIIETTFADITECLFFDTQGSYKKIQFLTQYPPTVHFNCWWCNNQHK